MKWDNFFQLVLSFILIILAIIIFKILDLDVNFIVTFILVIFSLSISIFFFTETNNFFLKMGDKLNLIQEKITTPKIDKRKVKHLSILDTINLEDIKRRRLKWEK